MFPLRCLLTATVALSLTSLLQAQNKKLEDFLQTNATWKGDLVYTLPKRMAPIQVRFTVTDCDGDSFQGVQKNDDGFQAEIRGVIRKNGTFTYEYFKFVPTDRFPEEPPNLKQVQAVGSLRKGKLKVNFKWPQPNPAKNAAGYFEFGLDE